MNDYYYYNKRLNPKKVIIAIAILLILVIVIIALISNTNKDKISGNTISKPHTISKPESTNVIFKDAGNTISVELKRSYNLQSITPQDNRLLILKSKDNLSLYISKLDLIANRDFLNVVTADKEAYVNSIGPYSNLTEIRELKVGSLRAFTYGLHFLDQASNEAYLLQIVWLEAPDGYYIFDVEYPLSDNVYFQNVLTEALSTFSISSLK